MSKLSLVIAEKPSVAQSIATALGVTHKHNGYLEGNGYLVSWCFGHLAGLANADYYEAGYAKWKKEDLPILPSPFRFLVSEDKKQQFDLLKELMHRENVLEVINACDAGREGELIFRSVFYLADCQKPMKRLSNMFENRLIGIDVDVVNQVNMSQGAFLNHQAESNAIHYFQNARILSKIKKDQLTYTEQFTDAQLQSIKTKMLENGYVDFTKTALETIGKNRSRNKAILDKLRELSTEQVPTIVFACSVAHAKLRIC